MNASAVRPNTLRPNPTVNKSHRHEKNDAAALSRSLFGSKLPVGFRALSRSSCFPTGNTGLVLVCHENVHDIEASWCYLAILVCI